MPQERPNFYELLELDPSVDDWPGAIKTRLDEKRRAWSKDKAQGNPKSRRRAEDSLARVREIEAALSIDESRRQEAKDALKRRQGKRDERLRQLDEAIRVLGGTCNEEQAKKLCARFAPDVSDDDVRKRIGSSGIRIGDGSAGPLRHAKEQIDRVTASTIKRNLDHLGLGTLYDFLGMQSQSSPKALADRATEIYQENQRIARTDATASAQNELAGMCKTIFQGPLEKERYDNYIAVQKMDELRDNLEIAGSRGFLASAKIDELIRQARQRGVSAEDARAFIEDYATQRKWGVQPDAVPSELLRMCGYCSALNPPTGPRCTACGEPLDLECPRCRSRCPSSDAACGKCGCRVGDAALVRSLVKRGRQLAAEGHASEATALFDKALVYWPDWADAVQARAEVSRRLGERQSALASIEALVQARRLLTARAELGRFETVHGRASVPSELHARIEEGMARAASAFQEGDRLRGGGSAEDAIAAFERAIDSCADHEAALQSLRTMPPPTPPGLHVEPLAAGFRLKWRSLPGRGRFSYRIVRKEGGGPATVDDGYRLSEVSGTSFDDSDVPVGRLVHYAVFSLRGGTACHEPARSGPHLRTADVEGLTCVAGDGEITVRWNAPPGCSQVEVWRKEGGVPHPPADGTALPVTGSSVRDSGLRNGATYGYLVIAVFAARTASGRSASEGRGVTAVPTAPPKAVMDLSASRTGRNVVLSWTPPQDAAVEIRQSSQPPQVRPGMVLPLPEAEQIGSLVPGASAHAVQLTLTGQGRVWFVPISVRLGTAVPGRAAEVTLLDPIAQLKPLRTGPSVLLTWEWPPGTNEALVRWSFDRNVEGPTSPASGQARVTRTEYDKEGGWLLRNPERRQHRFAVFACGGDGLYAPAARTVESLGETVTVAYRVVQRRRWAGLGPVESAWLELELRTGQLPALPAVQMVGMARDVPTSPRGCDLIAEHDSVPFVSGRAQLPIPKHHVLDPVYVKLFFCDPSHAREIRLLPGEKDHLRTG